MGKSDNSTKEENKTMTVNPLKQESVFVRFIAHEDGYVGSNKSHVLYGGMADGVDLTLCVPILRSTGTFKNVLTNAEKEFLEKALGLESNALSVYNKKGSNYWETYSVKIPKEGMTLHLNNPEDYIKYKVLLANGDQIAPSVQERIERPKQTYRFEIVRETEESNLENAKMDATMASYEQFKKIQNDQDTVRVLVELLDGRPYDIKTDMAFLKSRVNILIQSDPRTFLKSISDPLLHTKVVIRRALELGKITKRGDFYYLASDSSPLCENGENPTLSVAANFLNAPAHQDIKYLLESEVDKSKI